jgi:MoxR-like ATPase
MNTDRGRARQGETLVGRASELATLRALIADRVRLVAIVGPPGIGKTRLAQELLDERRDIFIDLSGARDLEGAVASIAAAMKLSAASYRSTGEIADAVVGALSITGS